jgi:hypothetical protein
MAKTHLLESTKHEFVDPETGEVKFTETNKVVKINMGKQEEFFMTYCNYLKSFYNLKYADDIKILIKMNEWAIFDTGEVQLSPKRRLAVTEELGIRNDAISKSLKRLKDLKVIDGDKGDYVINPTMFWKGDRAKRMELLRKEGGLSVTFNFEIDK